MCLQHQLKTSSSFSFVLHSCFCIFFPFFSTESFEYENLHAGTINQVNGAPLTGASMFLAFVEEITGQKKEKETQLKVADPNWK